MQQTDQNQAQSSLFNKDAPAPSFRAFARFFLHAVRPWRWVYAGVFLGVLLITAAGYVLPIIQKRLINALTGRESDGIWYLFVAAGLLMLLIRSEALLRQRIVNSTVHKVMFRLKSSITDRLLDLPPGLLDQLGGGYLSGRLANDVTQEGAGFNVDTNIAAIITRDGIDRQPLQAKRQLAEAILDRVVALRNEP